MTKAPIQVPGYLPKSIKDYRPANGLGTLLRTATRAMNKAFQKKIKRHNIVVAHYFCLRVLWEDDGITQREISRQLRVMEPTALVSVRALERQGLVRRVRSTEDKRRLLVHLTKKGRALREKLLPLALATLHLSLQGVGEAEYRNLIATLQKIRSNAEADGKAPKI